MHEVHFNYVKAHWWLCNFCGIYLPFQEALFIHQSQVHGWTNQVIAQQPHLQNLPPPAAPSLNQNIRPDLHSQKTIQSQPTVHLPKESKILSKDLDEEPGELVIDTERISSTSPRPSSPTEDTNESVGKKCRLCGLFICGKKQTGYNNHFRKYHLDYVREHWLSCQHCDKYFPSKRTLKEHEKNHYKAKIQEKSKENFGHSKASLPVNPSGTSVDLQIQSPSLLQSCIKESKIQNKDEDEVVTDRFSPIPPQSPSKGANDNVGTNCRLCGALLKGKTNLQYNIHMRHYHLNYVKENWLPCKYCDKHFPTKKNLDDHEKRCCNIRIQETFSEAQPNPSSTDQDGDPDVGDCQAKSIITLTPIEQDTSDSESSEDDSETNPAEFLHQSIKIEEEQIPISDEIFEPKLDQMCQEVSSTTSPPLNSEDTINARQSESPSDENVPSPEPSPKLNQSTALIDHDYFKHTTNDNKPEDQSEVTDFTSTSNSWTNICDTLLPSPTSLENHLRLHHQPSESLISNSKTDTCPLEVSECLTLETEMTQLVDNPDEFSEEEDEYPAKNESVTETKFQCNICKKYLSSNKVLKLHKIRIHKAKVFEAWSESKVKKYKCKLCSVTFHEERSIIAHMRINHRYYVAVSTQVFQGSSN